MGLIHISNNNNKLIFGTPGDGFGEKDVVQAAQNKRQHYTPPTQPRGITGGHSYPLLYQSTVETPPLLHFICTLIAIR